MSEILSQQEIDALLSAYSTGAAGRSSDGSPSHEARLYDFARPERFSKDEIRRLEAVHRNFASRISNHFSAMLRGSFEVEHTTLDQSSFDEYLKSIPAPTLVCTFRVDPGNSRCLIEINPNVVFAIVDLLTGGNGDALLQSREMTEIELKLMESVVRSMLGHYVNSWEQFARLSVELERVGANQMVSPIAPSQERMVSSFFEARVGSQVGLVSMCVPIRGLEAILGQLRAQAERMAKEPDLQVRQAIADHLHGSSLSVSAVLGSAEIRISELLDIKRGDCLRLGQSVDREIVCDVQGVPKFYAVPGIVGRKLGVQITRDYNSESDCHEEQP